VYTVKRVVCLCTFEALIKDRVCTSMDILGQSLVAAPTAPRFSDAKWSQVLILVFIDLPYPLPGLIYFLDFISVKALIECNLVVRYMGFLRRGSCSALNI